MSNTTRVTSAAPESDPTLSTLIPQRSVRRNVVLATAALVLLVGAWASPVVLRPSVLSDSSSGALMALARQHQVVTIGELTPKGWPNVGVQSVSDLPGASVAGAWVLPGDSPESDVRTSPADYPTGLAYLRALLPRGDFGPASQLPHRVGQGESAQLVILWNISDCARLIQGQRPQIQLTSILGTKTQEQLPDWAAPGFSLDTLTESGTCPRP